MRSPIFVRTLSEEEREALEEGLRSSKGFVLRRCQILSPVRTARRAFIALHLYSAPSHVEVHPLYLGGTSAVISPATVVLCRIVDTDFRELLY
jgi:hypothetical protein